MLHASSGSRLGTAVFKLAGIQTGLYSNWTLFKTVNPWEFLRCLKLVNRESSN